MHAIELSNDSLRIVIDPAKGCDLDTLELRGPDGSWVPLLVPRSEGGGSFLMLPWTNRIKDAQFTFEGIEHQLIANHSDGTAIHGIGRDHPWTILDRSPFSARLSLDSRLLSDPNCPFAFGAVFRVEIHDDRVELDLDLTNLGDRSMPCGVGHHPYFVRTLFDPADDLRIRADTRGRYPCVDQIPTGDLVDDGITRSLRAGGPIGNPDLDDVFGGFGGLAELEWDASKVRCVMECSDAFGHLVVYAPRESESGADGSGVPPPTPFVCVEPVTMVNDGFNRYASDEGGTGVRVLEAGETLSTSMILRIERL